MDLTLRELLWLTTPLVLAELGLKAYCLIDLRRQPPQRFTRWTWAVIVVLVSLFGPVSYLMFGRKQD